MNSAEQLDGAGREIGYAWYAEQHSKLPEYKVQSESGSTQNPSNLYSRVAMKAKGLWYAFLKEESAIPPSIWPAQQPGQRHEFMLIAVHPKEPQH